MNDQVQNQITLHSSADCTLDRAASALANKLGLTCTSANGNNAGCAYQQKENNTFGHLFNMQAGGVYAHTLEADGISVWFFDRDAIPGDIAAKTPDPSGWGTPTAYFPNTHCDIAAKFKKQQLIFDTTLCGDWAGPAYAQSSCPGTCEDAVKNASNFDGASCLFSVRARCLRPCAAAARGPVLVTAVEHRHGPDTDIFCPGSCAMEDRLGSHLPIDGAGR